jgi:rubredoxin
MHENLSTSSRLPEKKNCCKAGDKSPTEISLDVRKMQKMVCTICGHVYDSGDGDAGVSPGVDFESVPADWFCPVCGAEKSRFVPKD